MSPSRNGTHNLVLQRIPAADLRRLKPALEPVELDYKETIYEQDGRIEHMYFVESGVVSVVTDMVDAETVETGTIGNESAVGLPAFLGATRSHNRVFCQIAGHGLRIPVGIMLEERARNTPIAKLLFRLTNATMSMLAQSAACNRAHPLDERMARWLLTTHDRVHRDEFALTQEFLAVMLGVRRPSVNTAGLALQEAGLIRYSRGKITITNRAGLESSSCECYRRVAREFERALDMRPSHEPSHRTRRSSA